MNSMKWIGAGAGLALALSASPSFANQPVAQHTPGVLAKAKAALAAKAATHRKAAPVPAHSMPASRPTMAAKPPASIATAPGEHSAISIACSKKADAQGLHGDARRSFRNKCKHGG